MSERLGTHSDSVRIYSGFGFLELKISLSFEYFINFGLDLCGINLGLNNTFKLLF